MKLLLIWGVAGIAFAALWLLRMLEIFDAMDGLFYGMGVVCYMIGISAATWALVEKPKAVNAELG